ncbi:MULTISPECIES: methyltransferase domain-containing protein [Arthrobacter]|jgi:ubiquinone/menaquinone biosynthesis C-methylase UbiE|uniref:methyltransferase domain-containing protein n=1 Tax=Arthrobacter TaxID=1663 RepID=UPI000990C9BE|nr:MULTISPECIES: methyltransferase domain-containing protein [Arthrobacter]MCI0142438.1 methyltransferase domain-containing protein [Arthrobacter bambusae]MDQ0210640.1 ubiquinone/menaquinone biosynthesis C-methylase UbiE [Arthrobacter bambusae]MDQ0235312.1 ubiquinone/menaquinone biosynthesis C-methylase UbiE [Arthrobacter bambusae]OOP61670.1 SAM-dependent methyltransferase [Arthrobacter sp. SRS-W-1-2016]UYY81189.1 methyltransferase domain-containing protein [Arthrobacter sp. YA7-1]
MNEQKPEDVYTHGHHESVVRAHASRTAENSAAFVIPHLTAGTSVLDVGCGPGSITCDFAELVAPAKVVGLDRSAEIVAQAATLAAERGVENVEFVTGNIYDLDFEDETFDLVHAHQVLQHLTDPVAALREMRRVAKPGAIVAVRDADFHGMSWYPEVRELDDWMELYQKIARRNGAEPDAGRRLVSWAQQAGFTDVAPSSSNWLYATAQQRRWQSRVWSERVLHSAFAEQALEYGLANEADLARIAAGWHRWGSTDDGFFLIPNGEVIARA